MKKILLFALAVLALTACKTNEQRVAEDYLKQHMKCPYTFKLVEYTQTDYPTEEKRDTLYRISRIKGKKIFDGYQINDKFMAMAKKDAMVLHCLPAHRGEEITADVFEEHAKEIFEESENRLHAQKAVLVKCMG